MNYIIKRNGNIVPFDRNKIIQAINKAFTEKKAMVIDMIKDKISIDFISKYSNLSKEDIRTIANDNNLVIFPK